MHQNNTDVLVVGAGPTGLTMALTLAEQGVRVRIIDQSLEPSAYSKALVVQAKSMELMQKLGAIDDFLAAGFKGSGVRMVVEGRQRLHVSFKDIGFRTTPYPYILFISQAETERILTAQLEKRGIKIERGVKLIEFEEESGESQRRHSAQSDAETTIKSRVVDHLGRASEITSQYLCGCDGAHSTVRKALGLEFKGAAYDQSFILGDVRANSTIPSDKLTVYLGKEGVMAVFPFGDGSVRLIAARPDRAEGSCRDDELSLEELQEAAQYYVKKRGVQLHEPRWLARFRLHHRAVDRYAQGRIFLAGDAAHIHSPAGGQGMNTGIQDAYNLAWKIGLVHRRLANIHLLESYDSERRPVGQFLLKRTDRFFELAASGTRRLTMVRNALLPPVVRLLISSERGRRMLFGFISQLGIKYLNSPVVAETVARPVGRFFRGPLPGCQAPDAPLTLSDGKSSTLFDVMRGPKFHLLVMKRKWDESYWGSMRPQLESDLGSLADVTTIHGITGSTICFDRYGVDEEALYLIRPDGYVAYRSNRLNPQELRRYIGCYQST